MAHMRCKRRRTVDDVRARLDKITADLADPIGQLDPRYAGDGQHLSGPSPPFAITSWWREAHVDREPSVARLAVFALRDRESPLRHRATSTTSARLLGGLGLRQLHRIIGAELPFAHPSRFEHQSSDVLGGHRQDSDVRLMISSNATRIA